MDWMTIVNYFLKVSIFYEKIIKYTGISEAEALIMLIYIILVTRFIFLYMGPNRPHIIWLFIYMFFGLGIFIFHYIPNYYIYGFNGELTKPNITFKLNISSLFTEKGTEFKSNIDKAQKGVIFALDGHINVGKSLLAGIICGINIQHGYHMEGVTRGTNIYSCPKLTTSTNSFFVIDKEGLGRAEGDFNNRLIGTTALNSFYYRYPHKTLYIAKDLTDMDRKNIEVMTKPLKKDGKDGYIIHNFAESTDIKDIEQKIQVQIIDNFNASEIGGRKPYYVSRHSTGVKFYHFILAKIGSQAGDYYNGNTLQNLVDKISDQPQNQLNIVNAILDFLQREVMHFVTFKDEEQYGNNALGLISTLSAQIRSLIWGDSVENKTSDVFDNYKLELTTKEDGIRFKNYQKNHSIISVIEHFREMGGINVNMLKGFMIQQSITEDENYHIIEIDAPGVKRENLKFEKSYRDPMDQKTYGILEFTKPIPKGKFIENNRGFGKQIHQIEILPFNHFDEIKKSIKVEDGVIQIKMKIKNE